MSFHKKTTINSCIFLHNISSINDNEELGRRAAKALAHALYRSLSKTDYNRLIDSLEAEQQANGDVILRTAR